MTQATLTQPASVTTAHQTYSSWLDSTGQDNLGMVVWYYVPSGAKVTYQEFSNLIDKHKAPIVKKKAPAKANVFRRACTAAARANVAGPDASTRCNYEIDDAGPDPEWIFRSVVEQQVDRDQHELSHRVLANMTFHKLSGKLKWDDQIDDLDPAWSTLQDIKASIQGFITREGETIYHQPLRDAARIALESTLNGVRIREGGGVYFIHQDHFSDLEAVNALMNEIPGIRMHMLPLPNHSEQREMLKTEFLNEVDGKCDELIDELMEEIQGNSITDKKANELVARYQAVKDKASNFEALLNGKLDSAQVRIDVVERQVRRMLDLIGG